MRKLLLTVTSVVAIVIVLSVWTMGGSVAAGTHNSVHRVTKTVHATTVNGRFGFSPGKLTIRVGTKVVWTNSTQAPHTITGSGHWSINKQLPPGASVSNVFTKVGTYHYYCAIHPYMVATVIVHK